MPIEVPAAEPGARLDPQFCPATADVLGFVRHGHVWLAHVPSGREWCLSALEPAGWTAGAPPYVVQEEFDRYSGFWWQPAPAAETTSGAAAGRPQRVLYEAVDERHVAEVLLPSYTSLATDAAADGFRFPRTGARNPTVELVVAEWTPDACRRQPLPFSLKALFPWHEYVVRAGWVSDTQVWVQLVDRPQTRLELVVIPASCFGLTVPPAVDMAAAALAFAAAHCHVVRVETCARAWVNVHDVLAWIPAAADPAVCQFVWATEASGFRHLHLCRSRKNPLSGGAPVHER